MKSESITVKTGQNLKEQLEEQASEQQRSQASVVREALTEFLGER